ncbi:MAG: hypothetical protein DDT34_02268 [Firmicutes bacterium]|nr:hypothetical protein [Bacillota bacterium]MBT9157999.1 hypothetical protein [Bacillota bacterium]
MARKLVAALMLTFVYFGSFLSVRAFSPQPGTVDDPIISVSYFVQGIAPLQNRLNALEAQATSTTALATTIQQLQARIVELERQVAQLERQSIAPPVVPTPTPNPPIVVHGFITGAAVVNVRQGAGTNFAVLTTVTNNTRVEILERGRDWHRVRLADGRIGFIHVTLVRIP